MTSRLRRTVIGLLAVAAPFLAVARDSHAAIINGGFETGDFTGYTTTGDASIKTAAFGITPPEGTHQALITNNAPAVAASAVETFLALPATTLTAAGATNGSAFKQTFTLNAGDTLSFQWNFLTSEFGPDPDFNDFGFYTLNGVLTRLADTLSPLVAAPPATGFVNQTGYATVTLTGLAAGSYTLGFGVVNVTDTFIASGLLVDNLLLTPRGPTTPEPASLTLLGLGGLGLLVGVRRRQAR
jgi:hypothetical protein